MLEDPRANMNHNRPQLVKSVGVVRSIGDVYETKFEWKHDSVTKFDVSLQLILVLKPFKMQRKYVGQLFYLHAVLAVRRA
jgi:hypothetical protein